MFLALAELASRDSAPYKATRCDARRHAGKLNRTEINYIFCSLKKIVHTTNFKKYKLMNSSKISIKLNFLKNLAGINF